MGVVSISLWCAGVRGGAEVDEKIVCCGCAHHLIVMWSASVCHVQEPEEGTEMEEEEIEELREALESDFELG